MEALFWSINYRNRTDEYIHTVQKLTPKRNYRDGKINSSLDFDCTSNFFVKGTEKPGIAKFTGYCLSINHTKFVMNSRTWSCQVHLDMFPPLYFLNTMYTYKRSNDDVDHLYIHPSQINLWYYPKGDWIYNWIPSKMSLIKANIVMFEDEIQWIKRNLYSIWMHQNSLRSHSLSLPDIANEIYIAMLTKRLKSRHDCNITKVVTLKPCFSCYWNDAFKHNFLHVTTISESIWKSSSHPLKGLLVRHFFPTRGEIVAHYVIRGTDTPNFDLCQNIETIESIMRSENSESKFKLAIIHMFQLILKNYTYVLLDANSLNCVNGVVKHKDHLAKFSFTFKL